MNRPLRQVAIAALLMFGALLINSNVIQVGQASSLRDLAGRVESYRPTNDQAQVIKSNQSLYNQLFNARDAHDLDRARVVDKDIDAIRGQVTPIVDRSAEILGAYQKH